MMETTPGGGEYSFSIDLPGNGGDYFTNSSITGELTITHLDQSNSIISGTFWFIAEELNTGEIIEIREGRFDMQYSN